MNRRRRCLTEPLSADEIFLGRVGHDLRGELATIVAGVHYLMRYEAGVSEPGRQMIDRINGAGQRLRRLLDELELAVWITGGPVEALTHEPCRIGPLTQGALGRLSRAIEQRRARVESALPDDLPEIEGDPELLGSAIEMALDFAVARSPDRPVHITALGPSRLRIADEGGSPPPDLMARLFEPFVERDLVPRPEPGARRRERLGLGLGIARGILEAHKGSLAAEATPAGIQLTLALDGSGCQPAATV